MEFGSENMLLHVEMQSNVHASPIITLRQSVYLTKTVGYQTALWSEMETSKGSCKSDLAQEDVV